MSISDVRNTVIEKYYSLVEKLVKPLAKKGISPNKISAISLILALISTLSYSFGLFFIGGILLLLSGIMDTIDGTYARIAGRSTRFGALLDSTLDRYAEFFVLFGILFYYRNGIMFFVIILILIGSIMTSYIKARAESLGQKRNVGLMQRPERIILLSIGSMLNTTVGNHFPSYEDCIFTGTLILLAVLTNMTAIQRLASGRKDLL
ncbi:MAG TPA: CDP-alcohol phosphatidyltransferase family protein [Desulfobacteraceae bacterium]|nr:CDP-alcohol phosphatidyltransferase family protein [Desulfobacteraceae bacterium]HPQ27108.1 CDP-alcohol phosphatidyltransferase family protein [Desulfobacteraceae bacterium]